MKPSRAAIILDETGCSRLIDRLEDVLTGRRYRRWSIPLPAGYRPRPREWLGFVATRSDNVRYGVIVPEDVSEVFRLAYWLAQADPAARFIAWRHLRGGQPVIKYYIGGKPQLKIGDDPDVELTWHVPGFLPVNVVSPAEAGLPTAPQEVEEVVGTALAPYSQQIRQLGPRDQAVAFLLEESMLVD